MKVYVFSSKTCAPCKLLKPVIEDLKEEFSGFDWVDIDIHEDTSGIAQRIGVTIVPTVAVVWYNENGSVERVEKHSGTSPAPYYRILRMASRQA
uniref:Thioredoxin domain-containing protein n=1 Tax=viral metagenome TaxID=1070528 RepID=A0A6C0JYD7_9ZZZZ